MYKQREENYTTMLYTNRDQIANDLLYLVKEDSQLLSDIIYNYCQVINNKQFNDLEDVVNNEIRSIVWSFLLYYSMLNVLAFLHKLYYN